MTKPIFYAACIALVLGLAACSEKPQTITTGKGGAPAAAGTGTPFMEPGWKAGDQASWEEQMRSRAQHGQNEYSRPVSGT